MSINNLSKKEIIDQLQIAEYHRDAMRQNLENIQAYFDISITRGEMETNRLNIHSDEDYSKFLYIKLFDKFRDTQ